MSSSPKENSFAAKKEDGVDDDARIPQGVCSSRSLWQGLKDPRIVRVSRSFGGKDRHSKVRTIKGLRDRRVRLSVQTAIQLYDLQDRLGLSQPSKAVDWLLSAAEHEINKLPPLPIPPEFFLQYPQPDSFPRADIEQMSSQRMRPSSSATDQGNTRKSSGGGISEEQTASYSNSKQWMSWCRIAANAEKSDWMEGSGQENIKVPNEVLSASTPAIVPLPPHNYYSSFPNTSYSHWNLHPNASNIASTGHGYSTQSAGESPHNFSTTTPLLPPSFSLPFGSHLIFPTSHLSMSADSGPKQTSQIPMLSSSSQLLFPNSITPSLYSTPNHDTQSSSSLFLNQP
ncbi:hypothetical protein ACLOJK_002492 [Asimina triloba]